MALRYCRSVNNYVADEDDENAAKLIGHPLEIGHGFDDKRCGWGGLVLRERMRAFRNSDQKTTGGCEDAVLDRRERVFDGASA